MIWKTEGLKILIHENNETGDGKQPACRRCWRRLICFISNYSSSIFGFISLNRIRPNVKETFVLLALVFNVLNPFLYLKSQN